MNAKQVFGFIATRYGLDKGWVTIPEVDLPSIDGEKNRRADAMALGVYSSNKATTHAFEIKVTRADWQSEMNDGAKAEPALRACTHFWLVTAPGVVASVDEIPAGWGWIVVTKNGKGLRTQIQAKRRAPEVNTDWLVWRTMMRFAFDKDGTREQIRKTAYAAGVKSGRAQVDHPQLTDDQADDLALGQRAREWVKAVGSERNLYSIRASDLEAATLLRKVTTDESWGTSLVALLKRVQADAGRIGGIAGELLVTAQKIRDAAHKAKDS